MSDNPMIEQVHRLIGEALAGGEEVFLPQVGSLYMERRPARRLSRRRIEPPYRAVSFSSQPRGRSLVERIAAAAQCDAPQAEDLYDRWLEQAREGEAVTIEGIGVLKHKNFTPDPAFDRLLNPQGRDVVRVRPAHRFDWTIWVGIAAIVIALGFGGYQFLLSYPDSEESTAQRTSGAEGRGQATTGSESDCADLNGERTAPSDDLSEGRINQDAARAGDQTSTELKTNAPAAASPAAGTANAGSAADQTSTEPKTNAPAAGSPAAGTAKAGSAAAQPIASAKPASLVSGRRYVVLGVYSTEENAARAVRMAQRKESSLPYRVFRFGEKFMVSPFESAEAEAAARFVRENEGRFDGIWIYTAR